MVGPGQGRVYAQESRGHGRGRVVGAVVVLVAVLGLVPVGARPAGAWSLGGTAAYVAVGPARLADTRTGVGYTVVDDHTVHVVVAGRVGVPDAAVAAVLSVTVTDTQRGGFVTVWPSGRDRPGVSTVNADHAGQTIANGATVQLGAGGIDVYASMAGALVIDVVGAYVPVAHASAGRFVAVTPLRLTDTRMWRAPLGAGERLTVALGAGVPTDALGVVVNLTVDQSVGAGYWTAFGAGATAPLASAVNTDGPGQTRASLTIVPLVGRAAIELLTQTGGHVVVDLVGWFTGTSAPDATTGLFVPLAPRRVIDTRSDTAPLAPGGTVRARVPGCVLAVAGNLTATDALAGGYLAAHPATTTTTTVSSLNFGPGQTVANQVITAATGGVVVDVAGAPTQVILDVTGYYVDGPDPQATTDPTADASGRFAPSVAEVTDTSVPADVIVPTSPVTLDTRTNPINGRRGGPHPVAPGLGCTIDLTAPRDCLVSTLDALGLNVMSGTGIDRERRLHQAIAVIQHDATLPATGLADRSLYEYLGIWPGTTALGANEARVIGTSQQGRPLRALRYGSGANVTLVVGVTHGDEEAGLRVILRAAHQPWPANTTVWIIPAINPDGLALDTRFLANGTDPNRAAPSQPEQNALLAFARVIRPHLGVYYHQNYGWIGASGTTTAPAQTYQSIVHLGTIKHSGSCTNGFLWCPLDAELGSSSILIELPDITTPAIVHDHAHALAAVTAT